MPECLAGEVSSPSKSLRHARLESTLDGVGMALNVVGVVEVQGLADRFRQAVHSKFGQRFGFAEHSVYLFIKRPYIMLKIGDTSKIAKVFNKQKKDIFNEEQKQ